MQKCLVLLGTESPEEPSHMLGGVSWLHLDRFLQDFWVEGQGTSSDSILLATPELQMRTNGLEREADTKDTLSSSPEMWSGGTTIHYGSQWPCVIMSSKYGKSELKYASGGQDKAHTRFQRLSKKNMLSISLIFLILGAYLESI